MVTGDGWLRGRLATSLVLVFTLSGLWHGAEWNFVLWGLLHGLALAVHYWWDFLPITPTPHAVSPFP